MPKDIWTSLGLVGALAQTNSLSGINHGSGRADSAYQKVVQGGFNKERLQEFFADPARSIDVTLRWSQIVTLGLPVIRTWQDSSMTPSQRGRILRDTLAELGPVFTKIGQTLAERPDLVGDEASAELRQLQTASVPFSDDMAFSAILEDLDHDGPLAPGMTSTAASSSVAAKPLFQEFGPRVASASLGQVYHAKTWDSQEVAVKVMRPGVSKQIALDWVCWTMLLDAMGTFWRRPDDLRLIADEVAKGIFEELDYHKEAENAISFLDKHRGQPFITAPRFLPEYTGPKGTARVLTMEWIHGRKVSEISNKEDQLRMVNMAVEACVSQLVFTGFVHIDPHEGNMLLTDDGQLAFLDFGLMGHVPPFVMEGFAAGIQHTLAGDYLKLAQVFQDVEFIPKEGFQRVHGDPLNPGSYKFIQTTKEDFAHALEKQMAEEEGGKSRFGAIFTGLVNMSSSFRLATPPYVLLFIRTFLTLEGIAAQYDPDFNIYEIGLPYALRRALAPSTQAGQDALRHNMLTADNHPNWDTIMDFVGPSQESASQQSMPPNGAKTKSSQEDPHQGYLEALTSLLGMSEGWLLRRLLYDLDMIALTQYASSSDGKHLRLVGSQALADFMVKVPASIVRACTYWLSSLNGQRESQTAKHLWEKHSVILQRQKLSRWRRARQVIRGRHLQALASKPWCLVLMFYTLLRIALRASSHVATAPLRRLYLRESSAMPMPQSSSSPTGKTG